MLCTHHVGPCWQGMTVPEGVSVQVATDGLLVSPSRPVAAGWAVVPPPLPGVSAPTTQRPCESYSWHDAGSAEANTAAAPPQNRENNPPGRPPPTAAQPPVKGLPPARPPLLVQSRAPPPRGRVGIV